MPRRPSTVVYLATSIDQYIARADGSLDWLGELDDEGDQGEWAGFLASVDHIVMGRKTFEQVLAFGVWPYEGTPLSVLSTTLDRVPEHLEGKASIASGDPADLLRALEREGRRRVYVDGGRTIRGFLAEDLIDELILTTIPVLLGDGIPLFGTDHPETRWRHTETRTLGRGFVQNRFERVRV